MCYIVGMTERGNENGSRYGRSKNGYFFSGRSEKEAADAVIELLTQAKLEEGDILVVGCSSSEVVGERIGTFSSVETAEAVFDGIYEVTKQRAFIWRHNAVNI